MDENKQDPLLQAPQEANTGKHINFRELEETAANHSGGGDANGNSDEDESPTKKAWEEMREEMKAGKADATE
jgi:hypothetical protein